MARRQAQLARCCAPLEVQGDIGHAFYSRRKNLGHANMAEAFHSKAFNKEMANLAARLRPRDDAGISVKKGTAAKLRCVM